MAAPLLDLNEVATFIVLVGGDGRVLTAIKETLLEMGGGLSDEHPSTKALMNYYTASYILMVRQGPDEGPTSQLIQETRAAHPDATGPQLARHFLAMGAINGIAVMNPQLRKFAQLLMLFSLGEDYADVLKLIEAGPQPITT